MVFVDADAVEAEGLRVFELIEILMIGDVAQFGIVHPAGQVDPDRTVLLPEIVRHVRPGHQVEPGEFHRFLPSRRLRRRVAISATRGYGGAGEHDTPCKTVSSIFTATPRPSPRPACERPWPTPRPATSRRGRRRPSTACASGSASF